MKTLKIETNKESGEVRKNMRPSYKKGFMILAKIGKIKHLREERKIKN